MCLRYRLLRHLALPALLLAGAASAFAFDLQGHRGARGLMPDWMK